MTAALAFGRSMLALLANPAAWALVTMAFVSGYWRGHGAASTSYNTKALESRIEALTRDKAASDAAAETARTEAEANGEIARANARIIEGFRAAPAPACVLSADDVRRLRGIR